MKKDVLKNPKDFWDIKNNEVFLMDKKTKKSIKIAIAVFFLLVGGYLVFLDLSWQLIVTGFLLAAIGIGITASTIGD